MNHRIPTGLTATVLALALATSSRAQCPAVQTIVPTGMPGFNGYGSAVAIDGDVAVVGARFDTTFSSQEGAAYVWRHDGVQWNLETKLQASDGDPSDQFGVSVGISGDVIAVGANLDDDLANNSGAVYVYRFDGTNWNEEVKLRRSSGGANENWGEVLVLDGNVLAASTLGPDVVEVFRYQGGFLGWQPEATLSTNSGFGTSLALEGSTLMVGDPSETFQGVNTGVVQVYDFDGVNWNPTATLGPANPVGGENYGVSVALFGTDLAVGANNTNSIGSVFVLENRGGTWTEVGELRPAGFPGGKRFGDQVALGQDALIAGDRFLGKPYEFRKVRGTWVESMFFTPPGGISQLGVEIAIDGNRAILASATQSAYEYATADLRLTVNPPVVNAGDTVTLDTFCGPPSNLAGMFVVGANGVPMFQNLLMFRFGSDCHLKASAVVPAGLAGLQLDLMSIGVGPGGLAQASGIESLTFQ